MKKLIVFMSMVLLAVTNIVEAGVKWAEVRVCNETFNHGGAMAMKVTGFDRLGGPLEQVLPGLSSHPCKDFYYPFRFHYPVTGEYIKIDVQGQDVIGNIVIGGTGAPGAGDIWYHPIYGSYVCNVRLHSESYKSKLYRVPYCDNWSY